MKGSELVIALDGPSGSGKSSVARAVAQRLALRYLDTGAMYRAVTWWMLRHEVEVDDPGAVASLAGKPQLEVGTDPARPTVHLDGLDASRPIRTREVTDAVSAVSAVPEVRHRLVGIQREIIDGGGIVVEGRDIGTVVAPDALVKIFLTASPEERAQRRTLEFTAEPAGEPSGLEPGAERPASRARSQNTVDATHAELRRRDRLDSVRAASPLAVAGDAVEIDSTSLSFKEVVDEVLGVVRERTGAVLS